MRHCSTCESEDCRNLVMEMTSVQWVTKARWMVLTKRRENADELKITGLFSIDNDGSGCEVIFFNRVLRTAHSRIHRVFAIEGDSRHAEINASELGLTSERTKTADTPENLEAMESCAGSRLLVSLLLSGYTKQYRSWTTRAAHLSNGQC